MTFALRTQRHHKDITTRLNKIQLYFAQFSGYIPHCCSPLCVLFIQLTVNGELAITMKYQGTFTLINSFGISFSACQSPGYHLPLNRNFCEIICGLLGRGCDKRASPSHWFWVLWLWNAAKLEPAVHGRVCFRPQCYRHFVLSLQVSRLFS